MHKYRTIVGCLTLSVLLSGRAIAQRDTLVLNNLSEGVDLDIRSYCNILNDPSQKWSAEQASRRDFLDPKNFHETKWQFLHPRTFWIRFTVRNDGDADYDLFFYTGHQDNLYFYSRTGSNPIRLEQTAGLMLDRSGRAKWDHFAFPLNLPALTTKTFFIRVHNVQDQEYPLVPTLFDSVGWDNFKVSLIRSIQPYAYLVILGLGILLLLLVFSLRSYQKNRDRTTLIFVAYVLGALLFFVLQLQNIPYQFSLFGFANHLYYYWNYGGILFCHYLLFVVFSRKFLDLDRNFPELDRAFRIAAWSYGGIILLDWVFIFFQNFYLARILFVGVFYVSILPLVAVYWLLLGKKKIPLARYFFWASLCLLLGQLVSFHLNILQNLGAIHLPSGLDPRSFLLLGTLGELALFGMGLQIRQGWKQLAKLSSQEGRIADLLELSGEQTRDREGLSHELKTKNRQLLEKSKELDEQRQIRIDTEYNKRVTELELRAIRAQINPHFIFNCLNSIQLFIMEHDYESAQKYLSDFSLLIRKTLEMSKLNFISLNDEVSYLGTYLRLEKMRFENKMDYEILIDPSVALNEIELPSMLLQPYIENAVKHGIHNPQDKGKLRVQFEEIGEKLVCTIEDNGIGIKRSRELSMDSFRKHLSSGMDLSSNRADLMNKMFHTDIRIEVQDKEENMAGVSGTIIRIIIPQL